MDKKKSVATFLQVSSSSFHFLFFQCPFRSSSFSSLSLWFYIKGSILIFHSLGSQGIRKNIQTRPLGLIDHASAARSPVQAAAR